MTMVDSWCQTFVIYKLLFFFTIFEKPFSITLNYQRSELNFFFLDNSLPHKWQKIAILPEVWDTLYKKILFKFDIIKIKDIWIKYNLNKHFSVEY